jgi:hypothetical protein
MRCMDVARQLFHRVCHKEDPRKLIVTGITLDTRAFVFSFYGNLLCKNANVINEGTETLLKTSVYSYLGNRLRDRIVIWKYLFLLMWQS